MSKIELDDITSGYSVAKINNNFQKIEDEINNKMLSRQPGTEPNVMLDVLDMNSNRIINLPAPVDPTDPIRLMDVDIDISTVTIDSDFALIRASAQPTQLDGKMWFDKVDTLYVGDEGQWKQVGGNSQGGGIIYSDVLPTALKEGDTYFDASSMESIYSYADDDSVQYLAVPLLAGSGGAASGGGAGGGTSTFSTADPDGFSLVSTDSTTPAHRIKGLRAGEGVKITSANSFLTVEADVQNAVSETGINLVTTNVASPKKVVKKLKAGTGVTLNDTGTEVVINSTGGGAGGGIAYVENYPAEFTAGSTLYFPEFNEQAYSYNDGDSDQYLTYPLFGGGSLAASGGGFGNIVINQAGSGTDGVTTFTTPSLDTYSFKRVKGGTTNTITVTENGTSVIVDGLDVVNAGSSGLGLIKTKTATQVPVKRLLAGTGVTLTDGTDAITINSTGGGGTPLGDALTRLNSLTPENNNVPVWTAAGVTQFPTTSSTRAMMGLSTVANTIPLFTGASTATLASLTPFMVNLLAQSGVPGALSQLKITSGSNANGNWLRIGTADTNGVQLCWHTISVGGATTQFGSTNFYYSASDSNWTFPQSFGATPSVMSFPIGGNLASIISGTAGASSSSASFRQGAPGATSSISATVFAIGVY